jgi:hypothetical protein
MTQTYVYENPVSFYDKNWYNRYMTSNIPPCFYCPEDSKYSEPEQKTGQVIDVCDKHFHLKYMG